MWLVRLQRPLLSDFIDMSHEFGSVVRKDRLDIDRGCVFCFLFKNRPTFSSYPDDGWVSYSQAIVQLWG